MTRPRAADSAPGVRLHGRNLQAAPCGRPPPSQGGGRSL